MKNKKILRKKIYALKLNCLSKYRIGLEISFYIYKFLTILVKEKINIGLISSFSDEIRMNYIAFLLIHLKFIILIPFWKKRKQFEFYKIVPKSYINKFNKGIKMLNYSLTWLIINIKNLKILLIPAITYDIYGYRLGRGLGFYDIILKYISKSSSKKSYPFGIIINKKITSIIPTKKYDYKVNIICSSNKGIIKTLNPF